MSWEKVKLGDIATVSSSKRIFARQYVDTGIPFYRQKEIIEKKNKLDITNPLFISTQTYEEIKKKSSVPQKGDLLITAVGATLGIPYAVDDEVFYFKDGNLIWLRNFSEDINSKYIYFWITSDIGQKSMWSRTIGSAQPALTIDTIKQFEIPVPKYDIQCKIVEILSAYDNLIENNQRQIKLLEEAAQRLYKEWFVDLHFPGYENVEIVDGVPEGWTYKQVDEFGEVITGKTPSTSKTEYYDGSIPFVTIPDMHGNVFPLVTEKTLTKAGANTQRNKYLPVNSVIVSCIATVGLVNIAVKPCQTNQQINSVVLYDDNELYFFYESMKRIKTLLDGVGSNGATMTNVNKTKFSNIHVLYPTEDLVKRYNEFCKPIFDKILSLSKGILVSKQARDRLLPKLMSGEIEV